MDVEQGIDTVYGKVFMKKQRKLRRKILVGEQLQDFARNTTLHGLRYITERGVTRVEKIFWLILFLVSIGICSYQIHKVWVKWQTSPVIVSIGERLVPVTEVPFPSVTICPQWKIAKRDYDYSKKLREFAQNIANMTEEDRKNFEDVSTLCDRKRILNYPNVLLDRNYSNAEFVKNIIEASEYNYLQMNNPFCFWRQKVNKCAWMLKRVHTNEGICYNFNAMTADKIFRTENIQHNYSYIGRNINRDNIMGDNPAYLEYYFNDTYTKMGRENGLMSDLIIDFEINLSLIDDQCTPVSSGYTVYVQHPSDMPRASLYYYAVVPGQTSSLALKYTVMTTSEDLKVYTPEIRQCYFPGERYLRYFQIYTESNCRLECLTNYTYTKCGCVGFYMPYNTSDRICTIQSAKCMKSVSESLAGQEAPSTDLKSGPCHCLPACDNIEYDAEALKTEFNAKHYFESRNTGNLREEIKNTSYLRLQMYFKSPRYVAMRRSELFGRTDFIANCGGLLGLFLGFSFLSLIEIIYFITLRIWCTFKRDVDEEKEREIQDSGKNS